MSDTESPEEKVGTNCKACPGKLELFEHRPDNGLRQKDQKLCKINQIPIADHRCVIECAILTLICWSCHLAQGPERPIHRPTT